MVEKEIKGHKEKETIENDQHEDRLQPNHVNNHTEHKWSKQPNQKAQIVRLDKKARHRYMLPIRNTLYFLKIFIFLTPKHLYWGIAN